MTGVSYQYHFAERRVGSVDTASAFPTSDRRQDSDTRR